jgi:formylglycine-generating enzyme required for sulfatase activity
LLEQKRAKEKAIAQEKAAPVKRSSPARIPDTTVIPHRQPNVLKNRGLLWITGAGVLFFAGLGIILIRNGLRSDSLFNLFPISIAPSPVAITATLIPTATFTSIPTSIPTFTPEPTAVLDIGSTWTRPADGMTMVYVPGGIFSAGTNCGEADCGMKPVKSLFVDPFWIDKTEVTNEMYARCVAENVCTPPYSYTEASSYSHREYYNDPSFANYPVVYVDHAQADTYCGWVEARLPTDREWEKAARSTDGRIFPWGNSHAGGEANFCDMTCTVESEKNYVDQLSDGYSRLAPVGSFPLFPSPYGALDMAGNVGEMRTDYSVSGGSWASAVRLMYTFNRDSQGAGTYRVPGDTVGFRCVRSAR